MEHRHLLPDEIDQLLDGEAGFGLAPLQAHVERCDACRAELDAARALSTTLEQMPHFHPSPFFSQRVLSHVQVFEPWHVTALDTVKRWVPRSTAARVVAGASAAVMALVVSATAVWAAIRLDTFLFFFNVVVERARGVAVATLGDAVATAFGPAALASLQRGGIGVAIGLTGFLLAIVVAAFGLRAVTAAARRRHP